MCVCVCVCVGVCACDLRVWLPAGREVKANEQRWLEDISSTVRTLCVCVCVCVNARQIKRLPWKQHPLAYVLDLYAQNNADPQTGAQFCLAGERSCGSVTMKYII